MKLRVPLVPLGARDERNFHLKSLMWIAQIVKNPEFKGQWLNAVDAGQLRNIVLMATRERE